MIERHNPSELFHDATFYHKWGMFYPGDYVYRINTRIPARGIVVGITKPGPFGYQSVTVLWSYDEETMQK